MSWSPNESFMAAILFAASFLALSCGSGEADNSLVSPSGDLRISVVTDDEGRMSYTVTKGGSTAIDSSAGPEPS